MLRPHAATTLVLLIAALIAGPALAQERGGISGKVFDKKSSHAIPFATVTVIGAQKGALTDAEGRYLITGIPPGTYELKVQFLGFAPASRPGVVVVAGRAQVIDFALEEIVVGRIFLPSLKRCLVSPSAVMLRRSLFFNAGGFDESLPAAEDYDLCLRLAWRHEIGLLPEPLVVKRGGHEDQLSRAWGLDRFRIRALW